MKRMMIATALAVAVSVGAAYAAELSNANGQTCEDGGTWHFVNNQTGGEQTPGFILVEFSGGIVGPVEAYKVLQNTQHFSVAGEGELLDAVTDLDGRLVLSDFECEKKEEPPKE